MVVLSESDENVPKYVPFVNVQCTAVSQEMRVNASESQGSCSGYGELQTGGAPTDMRSSQAMLEGTQVKRIIDQLPMMAIYF